MPDPCNALVSEIVCIEDLSFGYSQALPAALRGISVSFEKGSVVGITGPAGAGKSTLLSCINGVIPHYIRGDLKGRVLLKGQEVSRLSFGNLAPIVGTVFQDVDFQTVSITVEEEIAFGPENLGIEPREIENRITRSLESTRVAPLRNRAISTLSGGQKQRVAIAAVLSMLPELLLLDEPTSALDPIGTREVFDAVFRLNREHGMTILVVSQKVEHLVHCDRLIVMSEGGIVLDGKPREVFMHQEKLAMIGVAVPEVTSFAIALSGKAGYPLSPEQLPLTVDEAEAFLSALFREWKQLP
jgi:energy-coupling factor transporter ATP-binding protein EcfA2